MENILKQAFTYHQTGNINQAAELYQKILGEDPTSFDALHLMGLVKFQQQQYNLALEYYTKALQVDSNNAALFNNLGNLYYEQDDYAKAEDYYRQSISTNSKNYIALYGIGNCYLKKSCIEQAKENFLILLEHIPHFTPALINLGLVYLDSSNFSDAQKVLTKALNIEPDNIEAKLNLAISYLADDKLIAKQHFFELLEPLDLEHQLYLKVLSGYTKILQDLCAFKELEKYEKFLETLIIKNSNDCSKLQQVNPANIVNLNITNRSYSLVTAAFANNFKHVTEFKIKQSVSSNSKIKIGYISPDFRRHSIGIILDKFIRYHDDSKFDIYLFSLNNLEDDITISLRQSCDQYLNLSDLSAEIAADKISKYNIDILIDLAGYTKGARIDILAQRPAKIICHMLGYSNSMHAKFIGYFITSKNMGLNKQIFTEQIIELEQFIAVDSMLSNNMPEISKQQFELPEDKIIYGSFCQSYRIDSLTIKVWSEILNKTKGSVLWLYSYSEHINNNILAEFAKYNIDNNRIIFGKFNILTDLWQHRLVDVWLDTLQVSSATGVILALNVGVPILAYRGDNPQSRTSACILLDNNLQGLVADSISEYINKAVNMDFELNKYDMLNLFNPSKFVKDLEEKLIFALNQQ